MKLPSIQDAKDLKGKHVLLRVSFNAPVSDGTVNETEDWRIENALPTLQFLREQGVKMVLISHMSDSKGTLRPVAEYVNKMFPLTFVPKIVGDEVTQAINDLAPGDAVLLENIRHDPREKRNDDDFAKILSSYGDLFVNDDFTVSHREHAGIVGIPKHIPTYIGLQFEKEVRELSGVLGKPKRPLLLFLGGAKFKTKLPLIEKFLSHADNVFVGGALANNFFKEYGYEVGKSLLDKDSDISSVAGHEKLILPDSVVASGPNGQREIHPNDLQSDEKILDVGIQAIDGLRQRIGSAGAIVWNGPMGNYENGYGKATARLAEYISQSKAHTIAGGGDTVVVLEENNLLDAFDFVSTAGGAMLEFLVSGTLPGIEAIKNSS